MSYSFNNLTLNNLDSTGTLNIGTSTATDITFGKSGVTTTFPGPIASVQPISFDDIDAKTAGTMVIGKDIATKVEIGAADANTEIKGGLIIKDSIDTPGATTLTIGGTASALSLTPNTSVVGTLTVTTPSTNLHAATKAYVDSATYTQYNITGTGSLSTGSTTGAFGPLVVQNLATPPANTEGGIYYDTDDKKLLYYNGTTWGELGGGGSSSEGVYTGIKVKQGVHDNSTTNYPIYAVKTNKMVTLSFPAMTVKTMTADTAPVTSYVFPDSLLPDSEYRFPAFFGTGSSAYVKLIKSSLQYYLRFTPAPGGNWLITPGDVEIEPFNITYSCANADVLTSNWGLDYADITAPTLVSTVPINNSENVQSVNALSITLDEPIAKGSGVFSIKVVGTSIGDASTITVNVSACTVSGNVLTIPAQALVDNTIYCVLFNTGVIIDVSGNSFAGIALETTWQFTSNDTIAPTATFSGEYCDCSNRCV
jgi:hypothetical protein